MNTKSPEKLERETVNQVKIARQRWVAKRVFYGLMFYFLFRAVGLDIPTALVFASVTAVSVVLLFHKFGKKPQAVVIPD